MPPVYLNSAGDYPIYVGAEEVLELLVEEIKRLSPSSVTLFTDENTFRYCYPIVAEYFSSISHVVFTIKSGEQHKNIETAQQLWLFLTENAVDRNGLIVNLSGGVLSDMGGFAAATFKRGIRYINIPTTLLSMVDASVGGKVGVNFLSYKNQIGDFYPPTAIAICPQFLKTLSYHEFLSGMAEVLKHGLLSEEQHYQKAMAISHRMINEGIEPILLELQLLIRESISIKKSIVIQDPNESGLRKVLNFGHTIGHAIESFLMHKKPIPHGYAVAQGMVIELMLSREMVLFPPAKANRIILQLLSIYPKIEFVNQDLEEMLLLMMQDKKNNRGGISCSLLKDIGDPVYDQKPSRDQILAAFKEYCNI